MPVVGRPSIGAAAKNAVASCRLTDTEKKVLSARYGSVANFFRQQINQEMRKENMKGQDTRA